MRCSNAVRSSSILARLQSGNSALSRHIEISEEIRDALHRSQAIVSLETAITSHGLPYDQAISTANSLDNIIRKNGAVPAVIGILDGKIKIGLDTQDIQRLAASPATGSKREKWKVGRRDIVPAVVKKVDGGTTVSATSYLSNLVGIDVFVTGCVSFLLPSDAYDQVCLTQCPVPFIQRYRRSPSWSSTK
jgi:pseudouridine-5'-phosphate glycosidase/pseudouridine kinase